MTTRRTIAAAALSAVAVSVQLAAQAPSPTSGAVPTFTKDVAPIVYKNCTNCHRPGELAPMSLLTYQDARPWAKSIATQVSKGAMPPWHADPAHGEFLNDRRLSDADRATLVAWANGGAPEGKPSDLPAAPTYSSEWMIGQPDAIFGMQEDYPIPADGTVAYQYFTIPTNTTEDHWIQAMEVRAGNPKVLHHVIVYAATPAPAAPPQAPAGAGAAPNAAQRPQPLFVFAEGTTNIPAGQTGGPPLPAEQRKTPGPNDRLPPRRMGPAIGGFAPGQFMRVYQEGTAMKLPAGATLIFQMHYTPDGKATTDRTRIGVKFAKSKPQTEVTVRVARQRRPAHTAGRGRSRSRRRNDRHAGRHALEHDSAHARPRHPLDLRRHLSGWEEGHHPVGAEVRLQLADRLRVQAAAAPAEGVELHATAWYDNSANNKSNPDSTKDVWWGDQTWEEMMYTGLTFSIDAPKGSPTAQQ